MKKNPSKHHLSEYSPYSQSSPLSPLTNFEPLKEYYHNILENSEATHRPHANQQIYQKIISRYQEENNSLMQYNKQLALNVKNLRQKQELLKKDIDKLEKYYEQLKGNTDDPKQIMKRPVDTYKQNRRENKASFSSNNEHSQNLYRLKKMGQQNDGNQKIKNDLQLKKLHHEFEWLIQMSVRESNKEKRKQIRKQLANIANRINSYTTQGIRVQEVFESLEKRQKIEREQNRKDTDTLLRQYLFSQPHL